MHYRAATDGDLGRIKNFLGKNGLPELGVEEWIRSFVIAEDQDGSWTGLAGLETYGQVGLLRSVAVDSNHRSQGFGQDLVESVIRNARSRGISTLYLVTDNATTYFERLGFQTVDCDKVDEAVKTSVEFTEICRSATAMKRSI
jgi:amino-acid N-acetyltransferase